MSRPERGLCSCSLTWCLLRYATLHPGGASDDMAVIAATILAMAVDRAWAPATPRSPLREELSRALIHLLRGHEKLRPGALVLLQVSRTARITRGTSFAISTSDGRLSLLAIVHSASSRTMG